MKVEEASHSQRILQVIQHDNVSFALKMQTTNTEVYSAFNPVDLLTFIKQGSLTLFNAKGKVHIPEGSCYIIPKYADFKIQRHLNAHGDPFQSYGIVLPEACFSSENYHLDADHKKAAIEHLLMPAADLSEVTDRLITHFDSKRLFDTQEIGDIISLITKSIRTLPVVVLKANLSSRSDEFLAFIQAHITENINQDALAKKIGMSPSTFFRLSRKKLGMSPYKWLQDQRLHFARFQLQFTQKSVSNIYMELGFEDLAHFSKVFKNKFGYNPSTTYNQVIIEIIS